MVKGRLAQVRSVWHFHSSDWGKQTANRQPYHVIDEQRLQVKRVDWFWRDPGSGPGDRTPLYCMLSWLRGSWGWSRNEHHSMATFKNDITFGIVADSSVRTFRWSPTAAAVRWDTLPADSVSLENKLDLAGGARRKNPTQEKHGALPGRASVVFCASGWKHYSPRCS